MKILGIIPSRYGSTRFPAKALADIDGKSMIRRVYEQALQSEFLNKVIVATDHELILKEVKSFKGEVCMTSSNHQSGTDRCQEAQMMEDDVFDYIINIQGDEPFIAPSQIDKLASCLTNNTQLATLIKKIEDPEQLFNPNIVKVVKSKGNEALYFSREAIPYLRHDTKGNWLKEHNYYKHIGIYGYHTDILKQITNLSLSSLEKAESLEQLRWLENGYKIKVAETDIESIGIDTPEDLAKAMKKLKI